MRDGTLVALKFFRPGATYEGAVQRERYILDTFLKVSIVTTVTENMLFEALTTLYPHLTLIGGDCLKFQPEHNLVTCLAHLEYRGLHCIVLQLLDTNIRQVGVVLMLEMR